jgi:hypothetical protein
LEFKLQARTLDSVVPLDEARGKTLLFKMDIEGYESKALKGFVETLASVSRSVGFIEFDAQYIRWAGESPEEYLVWLQRRFNTYRVGNIGTKKLRKVESFDDLPKLHGDAQRVHTDLVLVGKQTPDGWLAPEWSIAQ